MIKKAPHAYRNIREAADIIGVQAHVLRFWESRFPDIQPMTRSGGRRYYRPEDIDLLRIIKYLLHDQGLTIRGANLYLKSHGTPKTDSAFFEKIIEAYGAPKPKNPRTTAIDSIWAALQILDREALDQIEKIEKLLSA